MKNSNYEICFGTFGGYYIRRPAPKSNIHILYEYFKGYDFMGSVIWGEFDIDDDMDKESAMATLQDLINAD